MEGKKIYKYLPENTKRWHLFTFSAFVISLIIFVISFATFIFLQTMIEFNIRQVNYIVGRFRRRYFIIHIRQSWRIGVSAEKILKIRKRIFLG